MNHVNHACVFKDDTLLCFSRDGGEPRWQWETVLQMGPRSQMLKSQAICFFVVHLFRLIFVIFVSHFSMVLVAFPPGLWVGGVFKKKWVDCGPGQSAHLWTHNWYSPHNSILFVLNWVPILNVFWQLCNFVIFVFFSRFFSPSLHVFVWFCKNAQTHARTREYTHMLAHTHTTARAWICVVVYPSCRCVTWYTALPLAIRHWTHGPVWSGELFFSMSITRASQPFACPFNQKQEWKSLVEWSFLGVRCDGWNSCSWEHHARQMYLFIPANNDEAQHKNA